MKKKRPLSFYLATGFLIFSALLLIVLWLFQTVFLDDFYKTVKTAQVKSCAFSLSSTIKADGYNEQNASGFSELANEIETQNSMFISVYDTGEQPSASAFTCLYSSTGNPGFRSEVSKNTVSDLYRKAVDNGGESATITRIERDMRSFKPEDESLHAKHAEEQQNIEPATMDELFPKREPALERPVSENLAYTMVVKTDSRSELLLVVESEITPVNSVVETLRFQLIIMTAVILLFSVVIAVFLGKMIAKPISQTNEKAKALARQDYDVTFTGGKYREITELNSTLNFAAGELKKVDTLQKELISNISHDLRTPLTMISGYAEVMQDIPGEMTAENLQIIIDEANRLNSLVTDLLDISRLQSDTADIKMAPFSLTKCIESIFARYTKLIESDGLNIIFEHDREVFIMGDELRMTQVLYNLINNAINYIGEDKTVIVRQTVENDKVRVDVIDYGDGISEEQLAYIWDRYYRAGEEHRRAKIGTGLGLSIVKNILVAHEAEYGVSSRLGSGSDFWFILPIIPTDED
ncbi:MAG: HAMP domain-containing histidine kinase [Ruminococcus sp.]|nr:HAMP domain-containing histidine kinase [Ruminococcus sp.]